MKIVDFFIVGAPKGGTTAMYTYLKSHPGVFFPERKEPHFFGSDLEFHDHSRISFDEYAGLFSDAKVGQKLGDASVFYLLSKTAAQEVKAYNANAKIVIMLRNPVDVMHSFHSQRLFNGTEDVESFAEAIAAETERRSGKRLPPRIGLRQGLYYRDVVNFGDQVERYFDAFGRDAVHIILYDDFVADLMGCYKRLCAFLEIDTNRQPVFEAVNSNKVIRFPWLRDMMKDNPKALSFAWRILLPTAGLRKAARDTAKRMNMVTKPRTPIAPDVRSQLVSELSPSVAKLEQLLDRDLHHWRHDISIGHDQAHASTAAR
jgi:hypothetical protein